MRSGVLLFANALGYNLTWIAAVAGAGYGHWWLGPAVFAVFLGWHLHASACRLADLRLLVCVILLGAVVDSLWVHGGMLRFAAAVPSPDWAPVWILALWAAFALTLNHCLRFLQERPWLAAGLGLVGAPLAYWFAAQAWSAVELSTPVFTLATIGLAWAVLTPAMLWLARRLRQSAVPA